MARGDVGGRWSFGAVRRRGEGWGSSVAAWRVGRVMGWAAAARSALSRIICWSMREAEPSLGVSAGRAWGGAMGPWVGSRVISSTVAASLDEAVPASFLRFMAAIWRP
jgi:hypothetical protein